MHFVLVDTVIVPESLWFMATVVSFLVIPRKSTWAMILPFVFPVLSLRFSYWTFLGNYSWKWPYLQHLRTSLSFSMVRVARRGLPVLHHPQHSRQVCWGLRWWWRHRIQSHWGRHFMLEVRCVLICSFRSSSVGPICGNSDWRTKDKDWRRWCVDGTLNVVQIQLGSTVKVSSKFGFWRVLLCITFRNRYAVIIVVFLDQRETHPCSKLWVGISTKIVSLFLSLIS